MSQQVPAVAGFPLPFEHLLWSGRPSGVSRVLRLRERYSLTDFRALVRRGDRIVDEIAVYDIAQVELQQTSTQRLIGTCSVVLHTRRPRPPLVFRDVLHGPQLELIIELLANDRLGEIDQGFLEQAFSPRTSRLTRSSRATTSVAIGLLVSLLLTGVTLAWHTRPVTVHYPADDAIYPAGYKRSRAEIVAFMEREVMPFARRVLGPLKGGPQYVTCLTCHGQDAVARAWKMPAVQVLPEPELQLAGMERYASMLDPQIRNAVYGYLAKEENQNRAGYMRGIVMPGMAALLRRPAYDFTQSYDHNRTRFAFGCYHCHMINRP